MTGPLLGVQMLASSALILVAAHFLTRAAHVIAVRTGLGHSFAGLVLLATATSLPELGTGVSSIVLFNAPNLAMGAVFGSNLFNLLILAGLDLYWRQGILLRSVSKSAVLVAIAGIVIIGLGCVAVWVHHSYAIFESMRVSPVTWFIGICFLVSMYFVYRQGQTEKKPAVTKDIADMSLAKAVFWYVGTAAMVIVGAIWLSYTGKDLVKAVGLDATFVGTQFMALCTSLPEIATSFAALRMGAIDLAVTNLLGSNLFNMGFVVLVNDGVHAGPIWASISTAHITTGVLAILMTGIVLIAVRREAPIGEGRVKRIGWFEVSSLTLLYGASLYLALK